MADPRPQKQAPQPDGAVKPEENSISGCVVNSHNEFDPLEEVIVGCVGDATIPEFHVSNKAVIPENYWGMFKNKAGQSFPPELMLKAAEELNGFQRF